MTIPNHPACLFSFERDEYADLNWMPLAFRYRLDVCGLKLSLEGWQRLPLSERIALLALPVDDQKERAVWMARLKSDLAACGFEGSPGTLEPWMDSTEIPLDIIGKLVETDFGGIAEWKSLKPLQRYVLCKLARSRRETPYFSMAVQEFREVPKA